MSSRLITNNNKNNNVNPPHFGFSLYEIDRASAAYKLAKKSPVAPQKFAINSHPASASEKNPTQNYSEPLASTTAPTFSVPLLALSHVWPGKKKPGGSSSPSSCYLVYGAVDYIDIPLKLQQQQQQLSRSFFLAAGPSCLVACKKAMHVHSASFQPLLCWLFMDLVFSHKRPRLPPFINLHTPAPPLPWQTLIGKNMSRQKRYIQPQQETRAAAAAATALHFSPKAHTHIIFPPHSHRGHFNF